MEWSDVRIFLAIARAGTLGAAARVTGLTQPTMGRRLKALEASVGRVLFQRTSKGFVLTDEGAVVMAHAERMEDEAIALQRQLAGRERQLEGTLRVSCSDWFGLHILAPIVAAFSVRHPKVVVELLTESRQLNLSRREADLVFRIIPFAEAEVVSRKLLRMPYGAFVREGTSQPEVGDGAGHRLIIMDEAFGRMPDVKWLTETYPNAAIGARSNSRDVQAKLCADGAGIAVLPLPLAASVHGLMRIDAGEAPPGRDTWVGYHRDLRHLPRLRALLDFIIESVPQRF